MDTKLGLLVSIAALSMISASSVCAQEKPKESFDYNAVKLEVEQAASKFVSLEDLVGQAGGLFEINEPARYINSAFLISKSGQVKNFVPAPLLKNFAGPGFDPGWEITTVGSGISEGAAASGFIAANLEQTLVDYIFKVEKGAELSILFFKFGASKNTMYRISYMHRYNLDGVGIGDRGIVQALANWATHVGADNSDLVAYVGNIGVRELKKGVFTKKGGSAGISGWAYGAFSGVFEQSSDSTQRKYIYSLDKSDTIDVGSLKLVASKMLDKNVSESAEDAPWTSRDMEQTRALLDSLRGE